MTIHRFRRIDRRTAEQLLRSASTSGRPAAPSSAHALGELLSAAAASAREGELAGEQAAMAAFRSTQLAPIPQQRSRSMIKTTLTTLLTAKILAPAAAAAAVGGITLASVTGNLPLSGDTPAGPPADTVTTAPSHSATTPAGKAGKDGAPSPSLVGLCQAYTSGAGAEHGKAHENPAFQVLVSEAGGEDNVAEYCADVIADRPGKPATIVPSRHATPAHPTGSPTARPTGAPEQAPARPTGSPTERPTTAPAEEPISAPASKPTTTPSHPAGAPGSPRNS